MNVALDPTTVSGLGTSHLDPGKFAVGQAVSRKEDPVLLRGEGRYSDDMNLPGQLHAVIVRSRVAHGILRGIDATEAQAMPGVHAVYHRDGPRRRRHQADAGRRAGQNHDGHPVAKPHQMALAHDKVRYVGDPIAVVVADTAKLAKDAAEAVTADIDTLPAVTEADAAVPPAPRSCTTTCPAT